MTVLITGFQGRPDESAALFENALSLYQAENDIVGVARCHNDLGELSRKKGDLAGAEIRYRLAARAYDAVGSARAMIATANLGLVFLAGDRFEEARQVLEPQLEMTDSQPIPSLQVGVRLALMSCAGQTGDWGAWRALVDVTRTLLAEARFVVPDGAEMAERAGDIVACRGRFDSAREAYLIALSQWERRGKTAEAEALTRKMDSMPEESHEPDKDDELVLSAAFAPTKPAGK